MAGYTVTYGTTEYSVDAGDIDRVRSEIAGALAAGGGMVRVADDEGGPTHVLVAPGVLLTVAPYTRPAFGIGFA